MKKMKLQMLGLSVNDLLSREQMKKVMGGSGTGGSGSGADSLCYVDCTGCPQYKCDSGCDESKNESYVKCNGVTHTCHSYPQCWADKP